MWNLWRRKRHSTQGVCGWGDRRGASKSDSSVAREVARSERIRERRQMITTWHEYILRHLLRPCSYPNCDLHKAAQFVFYWDAPARLWARKPPAAKLTEQDVNQVYETLHLLGKLGNPSYHVRTESTQGQEAQPVAYDTPRVFFNEDTGQIKLQVGNSAHYWTDSTDGVNDLIYKLATARENAMRLRARRSANWKEITS